MMSNKPKILIVDDRVENLIALEKILADLEADFVRATSGDEALLRILEHQFALILLDVQMAGMDGFETAELIRSNGDTKQIPIIFVTAISKEQKHVFRGYRSGAVDYLFKPLDAEILKSKVGVFLELYRQKTALESANAKLNQANKKILEQQRALIQEERLKVLLQMAGATAHELNQPLMILLGYLDLLELNHDRPQKSFEYIPQIKEAGQRLADTVKKIQTVHQYKVNRHDGCTDIINPAQDINILSIEDNDADFNTLASFFSKNVHVNLVRAATVMEAVQKLDQDRFDIILLDFELPDGTGFDFLQKLQQQGCETPVIVTTGKGDDNIASDIIRKGASDYVSKADITPELLSRVIISTLDKSRLKQDIRLSMQKMAQMASRDQLTGLYNRRYMLDVLEQEFKRVLRYGSDLSCLMLDLDYFKHINDTYGHTCGDVVLKEFSEILEKNIRDSDYAFRYGGEEFMVLLPQTDIAGARQVTEKIRQLCQSRQYDFDNSPVRVTVSCGIASTNECRPEKAMDLVAYADKALYQAKADGRNCVRIFQKKLEAPAANETEHCEKGIDYLKIQLAAILEKTRNASKASLELLQKDIGGKKLEDRTRRKKRYIKLLCNKLNLPDATTDIITQAAALHDCLKLLLGEDLLQKKESLTPEEKVRIQRLPYLQVEIMDLFDLFSEEKSVLLYHNEHYDGTGYPEGLKIDEIPLGARIFALSDALVAMTSRQPYREMLSPEKAISELVDNAGTQFDPMLVRLFLDIIKEDRLFDVDHEVFEQVKTKEIS